MPIRSTVVILTTSFPFGNTFEGNFISPELRHLQARFPSVHLIPCKQTNTATALDQSLTLHTGLAERLGFPSAIKLAQHCLSGALTATPSPPAASDVRPSILSKKTLPNWANLGMAQTVYSYLDECLGRKLWAPDDTVFYAYWCKYTAIALTWLKQKHPSIRVVARAHRGDLYAADAPFGLVTRQSSILNGLDRIFCISQDGIQYLSEHFPESRRKLTLARLGTPAPNFRAQPSPDDEVRIVSCSRAAPVKRLHLIWEAVQHLSQIDDRKIHWQHFGDGPDLQKLRKVTTGNLSVKLKVDFTGAVPLSEIMSYYQTKPVDLLINASQSEGIPVSMMEAMSCGIPCVGPAVGGIPELLQSSSGGELVSADANPQELARAITQIVSCRHEWQARSDAAYQVWCTHYNADINFSAFSDCLPGL